MAQKTDIQYIQFYTQGSAAQQVEPAFPSKVFKSPKARKRRRKVICLDPVAMLGMIVAAAMLISMAAGVVHLLNVRQETAQMEAQVEALTAENTRLNEAYDRLYDLTVLEQTALAMGMVPDSRLEPVQVPVTPPTEEPATFWEQISDFFAGLFS